MTRKIFIVEDNLILSLLYKSYMEKIGFEVAAELIRGEEAVRMVRSAKPDLILMDIALEGEMDGIEAMKQIRQFSTVPVIYVTGNSDPRHLRKAEGTGYLDYLIKPVDFQALKASIDKYFLIENF